MPQSASEKLFSVRVKIERTNQDIANLEAEIRAFLNTNPYKVRRDDDPKTGHIVYKVVSVQNVPVPILLLAGEAIQNLRSALDHLAYQLWLTGTGSSDGGDHVFFPIGGTNPAEYKSQRVGKVQGMRQDAIDAIDATEPYKGGSGHQLWVPNKLNNIGKHRRFHVAVGASHSVNLGATITQHLKWAQIARGDTRPVPHLEFFIKPAERKFPLKTGDILPCALPDLNEQTDFRFDVAFSEPQIAEGDSLIETLHQMANLVGNIVTDFMSLL
jgi:hypothetical protein